MPSPGKTRDGRDGNTRDSYLLMAGDSTQKTVTIPIEPVPIKP